MMRDRRPSWQYERWSLADIARIDDNYFQWLSRMPLARPLQRAIGELVAERSGAAEALASRADTEKATPGPPSR